MSIKQLRFSEVINKVSDSEDWESEWTRLIYVPTADEYLKCICSRPAKRHYLIGNNLNGNQLRICCSCRTEHFPHLEPAKNLRPCNECGSVVIYKNHPEWITMCKVCYASYLELPVDTSTARCCITCSKPTIHHFDEEWKVECRDCYIPKRDENRRLKREAAKLSKDVISGSDNSTSPTSNSSSNSKDLSKSNSSSDSSSSWYDNE